MSKTKKSDKTTVEAKTPTTDTSTPNADTNVATEIECVQATPEERAADRAAEQAAAKATNEFIDSVKSAVMADLQGQSYRATALQKLWFVAPILMDTLEVGTSEITQYMRDTLVVGTLALDYEKDTSPAERGVYKEACYVYNFMARTQSQCDEMGVKSEEIKLTTNGKIWMLTKDIPLRLIKEDDGFYKSVSFAELLNISKAKWAKGTGGGEASSAKAAFSKALSFSEYLVLEDGETESDYKDDKCLPRDAEPFVKDLAAMFFAMDRDIDAKNERKLEKARQAA
jgi:hypothetical protein